MPVDKIKSNPFQPRENFEEESLKELADSMKDTGVIQPIVVGAQGKGYQIIAGERRWRAAKLIGLEEIPCVVRKIDENRILLESLVENLLELVVLMNCLLADSLAAIKLVQVL